MSNFRFAHAADLHLDTPFHGLGRINGQMAQELRDASLLAWERVVQTCLQREVDFLLLAGDLYDSVQVSVRAQLSFLRGLERLSKAHIPVLMVHGNHDPLGSRWPVIARWPEGVTLFGNQDVETRRVERRGEVLAVISGISYPERHVRENLALRFSRTETNAFHIGLLHAQVQGHSDHAPYAPCSLEDLRQSGMDYWALGHVHRRQALQLEGPCIVYPGNTQARHFGETGEKGFCIVEVQDNRPRLEWINTDLWRFVEVELSLEVLDWKALEAVVTHLDEQAHGLALHQKVLLRGVLSGRSALHREFMRPGVRLSLLEALRDRAPERAWWDDLLIRTQPVFERETRLEGEDFIADLLRRRTVLETSGALADLLDELGSMGSIASLRELIDWEDLASESPALWTEAERLTLALLEDE